MSHCTTVLLKNYAYNMMFPYQVDFFQVLGVVFMFVDVSVCERMLQALFAIAVVVVTMLALGLASSLKCLL